MLETNDLLVKCPRCGAWPMAVSAQEALSRRPKFHAGARSAVARKASLTQRRTSGSRGDTDCSSRSAATDQAVPEGLTRCHAGRCGNVAMTTLC